MFCPPFFSFNLYQRDDREKSWTLRHRVWQIPRPWNQINSLGRNLCAPTLSISGCPFTERRIRPFFLLHVRYSSYTNINCKMFVSKLRKCIPVLLKSAIGKPVFSQYFDLKRATYRNLPTDMNKKPKTKVGNSFNLVDHSILGKLLAR